jgi:hypothetical protein
MAPGEDQQERGEQEHGASPSARHPAEQGLFGAKRGVTYVSAVAPATLAAGVLVFRIGRHDQSLPSSRRRRPPRWLHSAPMSLPILNEEPKEASELYTREGSPCATCTCSFMTMRGGAGTATGFDVGPGLTLRVCRVGLDPVIAEEGTDQLWCDHYAGFSERIPIPPDDLEQLQSECSRGFLGDLAQGIRPVPRQVADLPWYDRGFRQGWLPPHRIEEEPQREGDAPRIRGPWDQFVVVGTTPAYGDGHTPSRARCVLQAKDRRSYLLSSAVEKDQVSGTPRPHTWWVGQVAAGAAIPLDSPIGARQHHVMLVLRGGDTVLEPYAYTYAPDAEIEAALDTIADDQLAAARTALKYDNSVVAGLCIKKGLKARPDHPELRALAESRA